jgi:hypothetical protein
MNRRHPFSHRKSNYQRALFQGRSLTSSHRQGHQLGRATKAWCGRVLKSQCRTLRRVYRTQYRRYLQNRDRLRTQMGLLMWRGRNEVCLRLHRRHHLNNLCWTRVKHLNRSNILKKSTKKPRSKIIHSSMLDQPQLPPLTTLRHQTSNCL